MKNLYEKKSKIYELEETLINKDIELNSLTEKLEKSNKVMDSKLSKRSNELSDRWALAFDNFIFDNGVIKYVAKNFEYADILILEERLKELHHAKDPYALRSNRGKMSDGKRVHVEFSTKAGFPCRIFFIVLKNRSDNKKLEITEIKKHNDSRYGK